MNPNGPKRDLTPEEVKKQLDFEKSLEEKHHVVFTKGELILIFNTIVSITMKYGDAVRFQPIVKKIEPIVAVDTNIPNPVRSEAKKVD